VRGRARTARERASLRARTHGDAWGPTREDGEGTRGRRAMIPARGDRARPGSRTAREDGEGARAARETRGAKTQLGPGPVHSKSWPGAAKLGRILPDPVFESGQTRIVDRQKWSYPTSSRPKTIHPSKSVCPRLLSPHGHSVGASDQHHGGTDDGKFGADSLFEGACGRCRIDMGTSPAGASLAVAAEASPTRAGSLS
jgi:hypothetical protein